MNWGIIRALAYKDLSLFFRNRFIGIVTILGLVFYLVFYFLMPRTVNEDLELGLYAPVAIPGFEQVAAEGLIMNAVESEEALKEGVIGGDYVAGIALSADALEDLMSGQVPRITVYVASDVPEEVRDSVAAILRELAFQQAGQPLNVEINEEVLGPDMAGMQVPPRDRLRPMLAVFLIMFETFGLANLIAEEMERGTVRALLVTPMKVREMFAAKGLFGVGLALVQAVLFMAIVGGLNHQPLLMLVALLLGAVLATAVGFVVGALGKDFMSVLAWGMIIFIVLSIPAFGVMFPGAVTGWVRYIPSYYLVDTVHRVASFGAGWGDVWSSLLILLGCDVVLAWIGILLVRRKTG